MEIDQEIHASQYSELDHGTTMNIDQEIYTILADSQYRELGYWTSMIIEVLIRSLSNWTRKVSFRDTQWNHLLTKDLFEERVEQTMS